MSPSLRARAGMRSAVGGGQGVAQDAFLRRRREGSRAVQVGQGQSDLPRRPQTLRLCVYDRSGGGYTAAYQGSPNDPNGVWKSSGTTNVSIKYISKTSCARRHQEGRDQAEGVAHEVEARRCRPPATSRSRRSRSRRILGYRPDPLGFRAMLGRDVLDCGEERRGEVHRQVGLTPVGGGKRRRSEPRHQGLFPSATSLVGSVAVPSAAKWCCVLDWCPDILALTDVFYDATN